MLISIPKLVFRSTIRNNGRLSMLEKVNTGIITWKPKNMATKTFMIADELENLREQIIKWEQEGRNLMILENCELIFQDNDSAKRCCWLENLAVSYDYDLNSVEEILYQGHSLVNQISQSQIPSVFIKRQPTFGYGSSIACAATLCLDATRPGSSRHELDHFQAPGVAFFADWKEKIDVLTSELKPIQARLLKASHLGTDNIQKYLEKLVIQYPGAPLMNSDFYRYSPTNFTTDKKLTQCLGQDYRMALEALENNKRNAYDVYHFERSAGATYLNP